MTAAELALVPHHLLSFLPSDATLTVSEFRDLAWKTVRHDVVSAKWRTNKSSLPFALKPHEICLVGGLFSIVSSQIDEVYGRNRIPILVGGTYYYLEHVLFRNAIDLVPRVTRSPTEMEPHGLLLAPLVRVRVKITVRFAVCESLQQQHTANLTMNLILTRTSGVAPIMMLYTHTHTHTHTRRSCDTRSIDSAELQLLDGLSPEELYARLQACDAASAARLHPNDVRKVKRSVRPTPLTATRLGRVKFTVKFAVCVSPFSAPLC